MANLSTLKTFSFNGVTVTMFLRTRGRKANKTVDFTVDLDADNHCAGCKKFVTMVQASVYFDEMVDTIKDGWHP